MTDYGRAYLLQRLSYAPDLDALEIVYGSFSDAYRADPDIRAHYVRIKLAFQKEGA